MPTPPVYYTGDTWPPLTGTAKDANGTPVDLSTADSMRVISKGSKQSPTTIAGTAVFATSDVVPGATGDGTDGNWMSPWGAADLTDPDSYIPELEVTWDAASTPPKVETFRDDSITFLVKADND